MNDKKEPQSYGSHGDWVAGKTTQRVGPNGGSAPTDSRESETSAPHQGGDTSPVQAAEHAMPSGPPADRGRNTTVDQGGAKRGGYFKARDYDGKK
jgi:hypothetical protein